MHVRKQALHCLAALTLTRLGVGLATLRANKEMRKVLDSLFPLEGAAPDADAHVLQGWRPACGQGWWAGRDYRRDIQATQAFQEVSSKEEAKLMWLSLLAAPGTGLWRTPSDDDIFEAVEPAYVLHACDSRILCWSGTPLRPDHPPDLDFFTLDHDLEHT